jgi:hypothetical protein
MMIHAENIRLRGLLGLTLAIFLAADWSVASEPEPPGGSADTDDSADAAERDEILQGPVWRETMRSWDAWLTVQQVYDKDQVKKLKRQLAERVERMSATELEEFLEDLQAKLQILSGAEARDARRWLSDTLSVASDKYATKVRAKLPDVANLSAAELQRELDKFEERRGQVQRTEEGLQRSRQERVKAVQADLRRQHEESEKAMDRAAQDAYAGQGNHFVPSSIHDRKSVTDRGIGFGIGWGFW